MDYVIFEQEAKAFCKANGVNLNKPNEFDKTSLHTHMHKIVANYIGNDARKVIDTCRRYENEFWNNAIHGKI